ncbi:non-homologous end joining protein Ku [Prosthecomicrobium sp. N25]|uniref:non-homologous end joining protein Ku n=1 Tax=Prosthecomicrobium sp. N25 TaxID=3129254 RepID=UPI003077356F
MPRANWKGYLKLGALTCPVALYTAASTSERVELNTLNRGTGNRVRREWVDEETGKAVETEETVRGYEVAPGDYVVLEKEEIDAATPASDKTIALERFVPAGDVDEVFFDRPYYLAAYDKPGEAAFAVLAAAIAKSGTMALGRTVLFRRDRWLAIQPRGRGLLAHTLHTDNEVRDWRALFDEVPDMAIAGEMLDLARHIIDTKTGSFEPTAVKDRYEEALVELIRAKQAGRAPNLPKPATPSNVVDLMEALRRSAGLAGGKAPSASKASGGAKPTAGAKRGKAKAPPAGRAPAAKPAPKRKAG